MNRAGLAALGTAVERWGWTDAVAEPADAAVRPRLEGLASGRRLLSGTALGHPLHPLLVTAPIGAWTAASVLDLVGGRAAAARTLVGAGVVMALPTAAAGLSDWLDTTGAERRVGTAHALLNTAATVTYAGSWWLRRRRPGLGIAAGLAGAGLASAAGWLGGHLTYALGVGVDTNAFQAGPQEWTALPVEPAMGTATAAEVDGVSLVATLLDDGPAVLANRCSHRGGPLADGEVVDGCLRCPWHASSFDARTGAVRRGPASIPQPVYETRRHDGGWQVRRPELRTLRANPV